MSQKEKIIIFDTTLRDGEQSPGASMNIEEKVRIAHGTYRPRYLAFGEDQGAGTEKTLSGKGFTVTRSM